MPADRAPGLYGNMTDQQLLQAVVDEYDAEQAATASYGSPPGAGLFPDGVAAANAAVHASARVRSVADRAGVALASVTGTGAGGRISVADVLAAERRAAPGAAARAGAPRAAAAAGRFPHPTAADVDVRATYSGWLQAARAVRPEPTLFATGNLPPFTASGIDVAELMNVPWPARPALAAAPTRSQALSILEACNGRRYQTHDQTHAQTGGGASAETYAMQDYGDHPSVQGYTQAISQWLFEGQRAGQSRAEEESRQRWLDAMHAKGRTDV